MTNDPPAERMVDVALPPGRRSDALWAGGRGVGATTPMRPLLSEAQDRAPYQPEASP
jgi:hypothetical protein